MIYVKSFKWTEKDLLGYFEYLRHNNTIEEIYTFFDNNQIELNKLDINRIYRL